jgi:hypothetical protein
MRGIVVPVNVRYVLVHSRTRHERKSLMFRRTFHNFAACSIIAGSSLVVTSHASAADTGPCALLSPADIAKATSVTVGNGTAGSPIPGVLGRCTWAAGDTKVIVTLTDAPHMEVTVKAQQKSGTDVPGLGSKAVGVKGAALTGGYIVSVVDAKGGFGVSILGKEGTPERAIALAKMIESRR